MVPFPGVSGFEKIAFLLRHPIEGCCLYNEVAIAVDRTDEGLWVVNIANRSRMSPQQLAVAVPLCGRRFRSIAGVIAAMEAVLASKTCQARYSCIAAEYARTALAPLLLHRCSSQMLRDGLTASLGFLAAACGHAKRHSLCHPVPEMLVDHSGASVRAMGSRPLLTAGERALPGSARFAEPHWPRLRNAIARASAVALRAHELAGSRGRLSDAELATALLGDAGGEDSTLCLLAWMASPSAASLVRLPRHGGPGAVASRSSVQRFGPASEPWRQVALHCVSRAADPAEAARSSSARAGLCAPPGAASKSDGGAWLRRVLVGLAAHVGTAPSDAPVLAFEVCGTGRDAWEAATAGSSQLLWHGTSAQNVHSILHNGLRALSHSRHMRTGALFGEGIYLAETPALAADYAHDPSDGSARGVPSECQVPARSILGRLCSLEAGAGTEQVPLACRCLLAVRASQAASTRHAVPGRGGAGVRVVSDASLVCVTHVFVLPSRKHAPESRPRSASTASCGPDELMRGDTRAVASRGGSLSHQDALQCVWLLLALCVAVAAALLLDRSRAVL